MYTTETICTTLPERMKRNMGHETSLAHAKLKASKEVENKTKDEEHTFVYTEHLDDYSAIVWAQNTNGKIPVYSRAYLVTTQAVVAEQ